MFQTGCSELELEGEAFMVVRYPDARVASLGVLTARARALVDRWIGGLRVRALEAERDVTARPAAEQTAAAYDEQGVAWRAQLVALGHALAHATR